MRLITARGNAAKEDYKTRITYLDEPKQQLRTKQVKQITSSLQQPFVSGIVSRSRSVMRVLYTFSCCIPHTL